MRLQLEVGVVAPTLASYLLVMMLGLSVTGSAHMMFTLCVVLGGYRTYGHVRAGLVLRDEVLLE